MKTSFSFSILFLIGALFLGSCSKDETVSVDAFSETESLRIFTWADYIAPEVLQAFTKQTGIEIEVAAFENTEQMIGTLRAFGDRYDLIIFENSSLDRVQANRLLQPLDHARLEGIGNLDPKFLRTECDPENQFSLPYLWGTTLVAYRNDRITDPEPSFNLLFDESVKGHVLMLDDMFESLAVPLLMNGHSINDSDEPTLRAASDKLKAEAHSNDILFASDKEIRTALGSGDAWAALCYSGDAAMVVEHHPEVSFFIPSEGAAMWLDVMTISSNARNVQAAHDFISFMLQPEIAAMNANHLWCATPNQLALPLLNAELVSDSALVPSEAVLSKLEFFSKTTPETNALISKLAGEIRHQGRLFPKSSDAETEAPPLP